MIGTTKEMLLYFLSYPSTACEKLCMSHGRVSALRNRVVTNHITEASMTKYLLQLDCEMIRPSVELPALCRDTHGRTYQENVYISRYVKDEVIQAIGLDPATVKTRAANNTLHASHATLKRLTHRMHGCIAVERYVLPAVWCYEPLRDASWIRTHKNVIRGIIEEY